MCNEYNTREVLILVTPVHSEGKGHGYGVYLHFQQYLSYIMAVSFIGGGKQR